MTVGVLMFPLQIFEMSRGIQPIKMSNLQRTPLYDEIIAVFQTTLDMAHHATQQISRRVELCLQVRGRHFEQLLH